ncbi:cyclase family protein [Actinoallomurus soli]|uniref:cyclase family protein n=1 Tax=Actinoallomurus soli TaxID=2952535 RepID=UPI0020937CE4|nr:cyclase family protein [Actinoallomurus soli]MCO5974910.1 cyclase family protein [Actinoallomurus soli]
MDTNEISRPRSEKPLTNRGRWGADDDRGTLNFITAAARARGVAEAMTGRVVSLAHPITPVPMAAPVAFAEHGMPSAVLQTMTFTGSPAQALTDVLLINVHHARSTHIDALAHIPTDDTVYPGVPLAEATAGATVSRSSSSAFVDGIVTRGVFLDLAPGGRLAENHAVTADDLAAAEKRQGVRVESGDALVVRGGWVAADDPFGPLPTTSLSAVEWMAEREVCLYAGDIGDKLPEPSAGLPVLHYIALAQLGMPLIDCVNVAELARVCAEIDRYSFLFALGTIPVRGATGLPVNPLAVF